MRRLVYPQGGKNCQSNEIPESYPTLKGWYRDGKNADWLFKIGNRLVVDLDAREAAIERERQKCIAEAPKRQRRAVTRRMMLGKDR